MSAAQSKLAREITKDTYDLGFISLPADYDETALETALEQNITRFLLELGTSFAFVGRQKEIIVSGKTRRIDMLFYQIKLRCYIVVELKAVAFEPEFAGKLNFYVNAVNELVKTEADNLTIGLLICKNKNQTEVQWAFQGITTPMGVEFYTNVQIQDIQAQLPTTEKIQKRIQQAEEEFRLNNNSENSFQEWLFCLTSEQKTGIYSVKISQKTQPIRAGSFGTCDRDSNVYRTLQ